MEFCPWCANLLQVEPANSGRRARFCCPTCPYICAIQTDIVTKQHLKKKEVDHVFTWEDSNKGANKGPASCPECGHKEAFYFQVQIRSADEPSTTFYTCCQETCKHNWREE